MATKLDELYYELRARDQKLKEDLGGAARLFRTNGAAAGREFGQGVEAAIKRELQAELVKEGERAAEEFLRGVDRQLAEIDRLVDAGGVGRKAGQQMSGGILQQLANLPTVVRGTLAAGLIASFSFIAGQIINIFRGVANTIRNILEGAGEFQALREGFETLTIGRGLDPTRTLEELRRGTRGLVSDIQLLQQANFALQANLPVTEQGLGELAEVSRRLARAVGRDATDAFQRLINGIVKGEQNILEELGLFTRLANVLRDWEIQNGRSSDSLTQQQKILLFYNAVLDEARRKVASLGTEQLTAGERLNQFTTFLRNLGTAAATAFVNVPQIARFMDQVGESAAGNAGKVQEFADTLQAFLTVAAGGVERRIEKLRPVGGIARFGLRMLFGVDLDVEAIEKERERIRKARELEAMKQRQILPPIEVVVESGETRRKREQAEREQSAKERLQLEQQLADEIAKLTASLVDEQMLQLDRFEARWKQAFGGISDEARVRFDQIRESIRASGQLQEFTDQLERLRESSRESGADLAALSVAAANLASSIEQAAADLPEGTTAQRAFADAARRAAELVRDLNETIADRQLQAFRDELQDIGATSADTAQEIADARGRLADLIERIQAEIRGLNQNAAARRRYNDLLREAIRALGQLEDASENLEKEEKEEDEVTRRAAQNRLREIRENIRLIEENARAVIQLAEAFGIVDDEASRALDSIVQMGGAIARIASGDLSAIPSLIGGAASFISGLFGGNDDAERERQEELRRNTEELRRLRDELRALGDEVGPLESAMKTAAENARRQAELVGVQIPPGISGGPAAIRSRIAEELAGVQAEIARTGAVSGKLIEREFILRTALAELDAAFERIADSVRQDIEVRRVALTGNQALIDATRLRIQHERELQDALRANIDPALIEELKRLQEEERKRAEENAAIAQRRAKEDLQLRVLEAEGLERTASVRRLLLQQERELEDARRRGAEAAEIAAIKEAQLAERQAFIEDFVNSILRQAAERRGDTAAIVALDQAQVAKQFGDAQRALQELRDAGLITEEEFLRLSNILKEELGPAMQAVADEARRAAEEFEKSIDEQLEDITDPEGAPRRRIERQAERFREQAREQFTGEDLERVLSKIDEWERKQLEALEKGNQAAGVSETSLNRSTQTIETLTRAREVTMETAVDILRQMRDLERDQLTQLMAIARNTARGGAEPAAANAGPASVAAARPVIGPFYLTVHTTGDARAIGQDVIRTIDREMHQRYVQQRLALGRTELLKD